ncbi:MAG: uroporphyrinogen decarboxylase [Candidatus Aenigmarchaeota archaeon]|nr:uroporphyrinogen decarboxylase [Candidatus Aenigmarchaeota archaeon]
MNDFIKACHGRRTKRKPIWIMRQAGRYLPEYRELRKKHGMMKIIKTPELAAKVTLMPLGRFDLDAGIIFSDIMTPLASCGIRMRFIDGKGPVIARDVKSLADMKKIREFRDDDCQYVSEAIKIVKHETKTPLIGFSGGPFTLASYLVGGVPNAKAMMHKNPKDWDFLLGKLSGIISGYVKIQEDAGADAIQIFDSWAGALSPADYQKYAMPFSKQVFSSINAVSIHFSTQSAGILGMLKKAGGDVIGVDWRMDIAEAWKRISFSPIQGNLDPSALLGTKSSTVKFANEIMEKTKRRGHIFNLGHGILPQTPLENVSALIRAVHGD